MLKNDKTFYVSLVFYTSQNEYTLTMNFVGLNITCGNYLYWTASTVKTKEERRSKQKVSALVMRVESFGVFHALQTAGFGIAKWGWVDEKFLIFIIFFNCFYFSLVFVFHLKQGRWSHNICCEIKCKFHYANKPLESKLTWTVVVFQWLYCFLI